MNPKDNRLIPATRWEEFHPWPPTAGLRHLIFNARTNGFDAVIRRVGPGGHPNSSTRGHPKLLHLIAHNGA